MTALSTTIPAGHEVSDRRQHLEPPLALFLAPIRLIAAAAVDLAFLGRGQEAKRPLILLSNNVHVVFACLS